MTNYDAIEIIEDIGSGTTRALELEAWSTLVKSGAVWGLQGFYGREANRLIDHGLLDRYGNIINRQVVDGYLQLDDETETEEQEINEREDLSWLEQDQFESARAGFHYDNNGDWDN